MPEAAFNNGSSHHSSRGGAATHGQSAARNKVDEVVPPAQSSSVPVAVPAIQVSNPHQQLHNGIPRIIRRRPPKWTKRCQYDLTTGCHRGIECFFGHLGDVYTDSPTVLQEFTSNGFNTKTLRRVDLERVDESLDVGQVLGAVLPSSQRYQERSTGTADLGQNAVDNENAVDNSKKSSRDLFLAGAMDVNAHFTPREHLWDEETLHAGIGPAGTAEYERVQPFELPGSPAFPETTYVQERPQYPSAPGYSYRENDAATSSHTGLVYGLAVGMAPFFGTSTLPLESPGNLFRVNATPDLYYYGVDGVMYRYNPAFWATQNRQYHMDQHRNNYMAVGGSNPPQYPGPAADPSYQYLQSWINDLPTPTLAPEGYSYTHAQPAGPWPPAHHQQHGYASPPSQQGYNSHVPSSRQQRQGQHTLTPGFFQWAGIAEGEAPQSYEETFPRLTSKRATGRQRRPGSK